MLSKGSRLRKLIYAGDLAQKPLIKNNEFQNTIVIDFTHSPEIPLEDTYSELFQSLKADYQDRMKGKMTIRVNTPYSSFFTEFNFS